MISFFEATLSALSVHRVGNKLRDEGCSFSEAPLEILEEQSSYLMKYFLSAFQTQAEVFNFYHPSNRLSLNVANTIAKSIFEDNIESNFHEQSRYIGRHLYDVTYHPKIKSGELYVAFFKNVQIDGEMHNAIGVFKSENKETYLKVNPVKEGFNLQFESEAININNVDKGCLIINTDSEKGYKVVCLDEKTKDGSYWKDEFLSLKVVNDQYQQTTNMISICQNFIKDQLDQDFEMSQNDKADLLNKSHQYFKEKESFDLDEYTQEVLNNDQAKESFKKYKSIYDEEFDANIPSCFNISTAAVKKQASKFKSIIKLDKNFHIYVHGSKDLIEKGFDEEKNMNYYKVFFKEESI